MPADGRLKARTQSIEIANILEQSVPLSGHNKFHRMKQTKQTLTLQ